MTSPEHKQPKRVPAGEGRYAVERQLRDAETERKIARAREEHEIHEVGMDRGYSTSRAGYFTLLEEHGYTITAAERSELKRRR